MALSQRDLLNFCAQLPRLIGKPGGYQDCIEQLSLLLHCNTIAFLKRQGDVLIPTALKGLSLDTMGRQFHISSHPRFFEIAHASSFVRFPKHCELPDPFDGLLLGREGNLPVHSCMGFSIHNNSRLIGVVTFDSLEQGIFDDIDSELLETLVQALTHFFVADMQQHQLKAQVKQSAQLKAALSRPENLTDVNDFIGQSDQVKALKKEIAMVAATDFAVLVVGESGTGKELVAHEIHRLSNRSNEPLIYVNCAALPENLVESELFGHVKGAFTGAENYRAGKFKIADGGTLFLDEIGELPLPSQAKLLRVLQSQEVQPLGQDKVEQVNVRVIAATNRQLEKEVDFGHFRADLFHRLNVYPLVIPPLSQRQGDVVLLTGFFIEKLRRKLGLRQLRVEQSVLEEMERYRWPGNVRELEHFLTRAAVKASSETSHHIVNIKLRDCEALGGQLEKNTLDIEDETPPPLSIPSQLALREEVDRFQYDLIKRVLSEEKGNWTRTAKRLSVDRANLARLANRLGITVKRAVN
ncbi:nitric oxide reductase transcriptional regulator NorR [Alteromonas gracilis]|uniref:nitric oxide reductase transcriptional regulator NorR n=1 Tax=Alteromonas gracilis TaxID=1479524 RepID=UPI0030D47A88